MKGLKRGTIYENKEKKSFFSNNFRIDAKIDEKEIQKDSTKNIKQKQSNSDNPERFCKRRLIGRKFICSITFSVGILRDFRANRNSISKKQKRDRNFLRD